MTYVLGIDAGTQGLKAALYTAQGEQRWVGSATYPTSYPHPGSCEQQPLDWWDALLRALRSCPAPELLNAVSAVAVCATSSTVLVVDAEGNPQSPAMLWMDTRAKSETDYINGLADPHVADVLRRSGGGVSAEWMTAKSLWLKNNGFLKPGYRIMEQLDWLNFKLSGNWMASKCNAVCKWNYTDHFSRSFFEAIGLEQYEQWWPQQVAAVGEQIGVITAQAAAQTGLPAGIPIFQGGIDAHIGMLGIGACDTGTMSLITGTSFVHLMHTDTAVEEPGLWGPYANAILPDSWLLEGGQLSCGSLTSWFMSQFYPGVQGEALEHVYKELIQEASGLEAGSSGLVMMDSWQGNRTPYRSAAMKGALYGLTLAHTRYHIYRSILEGVAFGTKSIIDTFAGAGVPVSRIIASGGGTKNKLWMQIIADVTGMVIDIADEGEAGTKGCAVIAAYGAGWYSSLQEASQRMTSSSVSYRPDERSQELYTQAYANYVQLHERLVPMMEQSAEQRILVQIGG